MLKLIAFEIMGRFLANLLGGEFFAAVQDGVRGAMLFDRPGDERKALVKDSIARALTAGKLAGTQTADWAVNLAIEYAVAKIKLASPDVQR